MKMAMKKCSKFLFVATMLAVISSCTVAPLTGRKQLSLVTEESVAKEAASDYRKFIDGLAAQGMLANNTSDGQRIKRIGNRVVF